MNETVLVGASVLPVMTDPVQGLLYFLLCKDRDHPTWAATAQGWTDFGGRHDGTETAEETAAREFVEETAGQVRYFPSDTLPRSQTADIVHSLTQDQYLLRMNHVHNGQQFVTFMVHLEWDPVAPQRFHHARNSPEAALWPECYLEKSQLGLFSLTQVLHAVKHKGYLHSSFTDRTCAHLTQTLTVLLPELQFHFPHLF
jgi:hypothetical protein